jgi:group I intron endonuclease
MKIIKGVYCLTSPEGKRYVGIGMGGRGIQGRWADYKKYRCKGQTKLYRALKKYGSDKFKYEVILETDDLDNALRSEMYLIDVWNLQDDGYNISQGGYLGRLGVKATEETKQKLSESHKGEKHYLFGKNVSEETKLKLSESTTGEKNHFFGKKHSEETKQKMRKPKPDGFKEKLRKAKLGKKRKPFKRFSQNRTVKDTITGEIFEGTFRELIIKLNEKETFRSIVRYGKYKQYILINSLGENI